MTPSNRDRTIPRVKQKIALLFLAASAFNAQACSDDVSGPPDAVLPADDASALRDAETALDTQAALDAEPPTDARTPADAESSSDADALLDAGAPNSGPTQCRRSADCGNLSCNRGAPGGICLGCGVDADCPSRDFECVAGVGSCSRACSSDGDCNGGMRCHANGVCVVRSCSPQAPCPAPYVCGGTLCARPSCTGGAACPAPLVCEDELCVEP